MGIQEVSPQNLFGGILKNRKEQLKILEGNQQILSQKKCIGFYFFDISLEDHDDGLKKIEQTFAVDKWAHINRNDSMRVWVWGALVHIRCHLGVRCPFLLLNKISNKAMNTIVH